MCTDLCQLLTTAAAARMGRRFLKSTGFCVTLKTGLENVEILKLNWAANGFLPAQLSEW